MSLPDSYTLKPGSIPAYFEAMLSAEAPKRFAARFLESLEISRIASTFTAFRIRRLYRKPTTRS